MSQKKGAKGPAHRAVRVEPEPPRRSYRDMQFLRINPIRKPSWIERKAHNKPIDEAAK